jgi:ATP-dependent Clp protease ATP-binding subunit ClpB
LDHLIRGSVYLSANPNFKLVGRDDYLERLSSILMRKEANSVILVGAGGVGVTSILHGLQALKAKVDAPFDIVAKKLFWLDVDGLFSNGDTSELNKNFKKITDRLEATPDSVLMIEDTRDFIEACRNSGSTHFINDLMATVKNGLNQVIFETRDDDLDLVLKMHSDVREHFTLLHVLEPEHDVLSNIVSQGALGLSLHHGIKIDDDAVAKAIELTNKYRVNDPGLSRAQPERSATLLDRALASYRLAAHREIPEEVSVKLRDFYRNQRDGEIAIAELEEQNEVILEEQAKRKENSDFKLMEPQTVIENKSKIQKYKELVAENRKAFNETTAVVNAGLVLTKELVEAEFSKISGISLDTLNQDEREKLRNLEDALNGRVFGQPNATKRLANAVKTARVIKRKKDQPQAAMMFLGPSGVGKTEIAKGLAWELLGSDKALTRFDMAQYKEKHATALLCGAPPGYEGYEAGGILTNMMLKNRNRVILFDEIEKAHESIYDIFLSILSDSRLTDNVGREVSFNDTILIFTSNIGQPHFLRNDISFEEAEALAMEDLIATYRPEFLNRFAGRENIVFFKSLGLDSIEKIVTREMITLDEAYHDNGLNVTMSQEEIKSFVAAVYDPRTGARGLPGYITANLEPILADRVLDGFTGTVQIKYNPSLKQFFVE